MSPERLPWDMTPTSRRFVDLLDGELQISGNLGDGSTWGRRFDQTKPGPVLTATDVPHTRLTNFACNVPPDAPVYEDAQNGALEFQVTLGHAYGRKCLKWGGLYLGAGGKFGSGGGPESDCDNFMVLSSDSP